MTFLESVSEMKRLNKFVTRRLTDIQTSGHHKTYKSKKKSSRFWQYLLRYIKKTKIERRNKKGHLIILQKRRRIFIKPPMQALILHWWLFREFRNPMMSYWIEGVSLRRKYFITLIDALNRYFNILVIIKQWTDGK